MNTNKFKAGDKVVTRGVVIENDGSEVAPYTVIIGEDDYWFDEEDLELDTPQQPTEQQYNRGLMAATILAGMCSPEIGPSKTRIEDAVKITDILISELDKTKQ